MEPHSPPRKLHWKKFPSLLQILLLRNQYLFPGDFVCPWETPCKVLWYLDFVNRKNANVIAYVYAILGFSGSITIAVLALQVLHTTIVSLIVRNFVVKTNFTTQLNWHANVILQLVTIKSTTNARYVLLERIITVLL